MEAAGTLLGHPRLCCFQWKPLEGCLHCLKTYFSFYFFEGESFKLFLIFILIIKLDDIFDVGLGSKLLQAAIFDSFMASLASLSRAAILVLLLASDPIVDPFHWLQILLWILFWLQILLWIFFFFLLCNFLNRSFGVLVSFLLLFLPFS